MARRRASKDRDLNRAVLGDLIGRSPKVLKLLDAYGITFCAGCYLTLFASPEKAAVYHAVPNPKKFLADLKRVLR